MLVVQTDISLLQLELSLLKMTSLATSRECKEFLFTFGLSTLPFYTNIGMLDLSHHDTLVPKSFDHVVAEL